MNRVTTSLRASLVLLLGACSPYDDARRSEQPDDLTLGRVQAEIRVGMSGAEVAEVLGSPNIVTTDEQRREAWVYDKISTEWTQASKSSYGTLILIGGSSSEASGSSRQRTLTVIVKFDEDKKVRDFAYNYTQF